MNRIVMGVPAGEESLSLTWLYRQSELKLIPILTGTDAFSIVQPSELEDPTEFIQPGSVVLTVGVAFRDRADDFARYVPRLAQAGVVGIGFGTGLTFPKVPPQIIEAAETAEISLFEVPRAIPFISIASTTHRELSRRAQRRQTQLLDAQEKLNQRALEGGVEGLLRTAADQLGASLAISSSQGKIIAEAPQSATIGVLRRSILRSVGVQGAASAARPDGLFQVVHRMHSGGETAPLMTAISEHPFGAYARSIIKHCAGLADIILRQPSELRASRSELNSLALSVLLGLEGDNSIIDRVFATASDASDNIRIAVAQADTEEIIGRAIRLVDDRLQRAGQQTFAFRVQSTASLFLFPGEFRSSDIQDLFRGTLENIRVAVGSPLHWKGLKLDHITDLTTIASVLPLGTLGGPETRVLRWLQRPGAKDALEERHRETFGRLMLQDSATGTDLERTLAVYIRAGNHLGHTAEGLQIHRHTLRNRLQKISEICEFDLEDPAVTAELFILAAVQPQFQEHTKNLSPRPSPASPN